MNILLKSLRQPKEISNGSPCLSKRRSYSPTFPPSKITQWRQFTTGSRIEEKTLIDVLYPIEIKDDVVFDIKMIGKHDLYERHRNMPFIEHILKEGIAV